MDDMDLPTFVSSRHGGNFSSFARALGVSRWSACRYLRGQVPAPEIVERIYDLTGGLVEPNDLYPGLRRRLLHRTKRKSAA